MDLNVLRKEYQGKPLTKGDIAANPLEQLTLWVEEAIAAEVTEPNALILATTNAEGKPSTRTVLIKRLDERGLAFFTSTESRKAKELASHPYASGTFLWHELCRQVVAEGPITAIPADEAATYFAQRPRTAQLSAWASHQDRPLQSRSELQDAYAQAEKQFAEDTIPPPPNWCGYLLSPILVEFWQGRQNRLHDRIEYTRQNGQWTITRLSP